MSNLTIRPATALEAETVAALVDSAYSKWILVIGRKPAPMLADYPALIQQGFVHVLDKDRSIIAVLVIWPVEDALYIDNIAVHPAHQRRGIGDTLLNFAEQKAHEAGFQMMRLLTNARMEYNQAYYRQHGYIETRREPTADGGSIVWMHKSL